MEVVHYTVRLFEPKPFDLDLPNDFNFLVVAQWCPRKNIETTIRCFVEEFLDKKVGLILKLNSASNSLADREVTTDRLRELLKPYEGKRKCSVHLLHGDLSDEQMTFLYQHPKVKALVSLSNGEGFGLPIFEAVYNGLPVVSPAWGGVSDFIYAPQRVKGKTKDVCMIANVAYEVNNVPKEAFHQDMIIEGSQWCFPKEWHARAQLRDIWRSYGTHKSKALKLQKHILETFDANKVLSQFADAICEDFPVVDIGRVLDNSSSGNPLLEEVQVFD
jgi:glycosyltransferase involved in cell wall biosynthesis